MNKLNKTAYMLILWAVFSLCGCAGKESTQMYLEAKAQDSQDARQPEPGQETTSGGGDESQAQQSTAEEKTCFVYVCGAVKHPGVFELPEGSRVYEALALAGGLRKDAYDKDLNQAAQIEDGAMIEVLTVKEHKELAQQPKSTKETGEGQQDDRIDINTASMEQLMALSGIGEAKAANIISYRESNGGFSSTEDLMNVNGIGEGVYARIQDKIKVIR